MFEKNSAINAFASIVDSVSSLSDDVKRLNDTLYENYSEACQYYDDMGERTAFFCDLLSTHDV